MENSNLADRYFHARKALDELEAEVDALRQEIIDTGKTKLTGKVAHVTVKASEFNRFSVTLAKDLMTTAQIKACTRKSNGFTVRANKLTKADLFG